MAQVGFEDDQLKAENINRMLEYEKHASTAGVSGWLIRKGIARNRDVATIVLVVVSVVCFAVAVYFLFFYGG